MVSAPDQPAAIAPMWEYLRDLERAGKISESHLYTLLTRYAIKDLLGYAEGQFKIDKAAKGQGRPDVRLFTEDMSQWVVGEAKLDDEDIRNSSRRAAIWKDKKKYVTAETVYYLWLAPKTILVTHRNGEPIQWVILEDAVPPGIEGPACASTERKAIQSTLYRITRKAADDEDHLRRFSEGDLPARDIPVNAESLPLLADTCRRALDVLTGFFKLRFREFTSEYDSAKDQLEKLVADEFLAEFHGNAADHRREMETVRLRIRRLEDLHLRYEEFCEEQAYSGTKPEQNEKIFLTNTAYVLLGRLLFIRIAEDRGLVSPKLSNGAVELWRRLSQDPESLIPSFVSMAIRDAKSVCRQLFEHRIFDWIQIAEENGELASALAKVLVELNAYDFAAIERDIFGQIYQEVLPRRLRKQLGEFYTDTEVVELILALTGYTEDERIEASLLDPSCGSCTFLVQAAQHLLRKASTRNLQADVLVDVIEKALLGRDINQFAVYIGRMNLLFTLFEVFQRAGRDAEFDVYEADSLAIPKVGKIETVSVDYLVGNPPYVRNERLPQAQRERLQQSYAGVAEGNTDLAVYFVRKYAEQLKPGARFGMILPRGVLDAASSRSLREYLSGPNGPHIEWLVPLDWACHELFDADVVPCILVFRKPLAGEERPKLRLLQNMRGCADLLRAASDPLFRSENIQAFEWREFSEIVEDPWPIEVVREDLPVLAKLRSFPRMESTMKVRSAIKVGSQASEGSPVASHETPHSTPLLTGSEVAAYGIGRPRRHIDLASRTISDKSIWSHLPEGTVVALTKIHITVLAAVIDPSRVAAQDTVLIGIPQAPTLWSPQALVALLNSSASRYFNFTVQRSGVTGGGRRDVTHYPRTIERLPLPGIGVSARAQLERLTGEATALAAEITATGDPTRLLALPSSSRVGLLPKVDFSAWSQEKSLTSKAFEPDILEGVLHLSEALSITGNAHLLVYLQLRVQDWLERHGQVSLTELQSMDCPDADTIFQLVNEYLTTLEAEAPRRDRFFAILGEIDQIVYQGFGLTDGEAAIIERRMNSFPMKDTANNPRYPWSKVVRPRLRHFLEGERYH